MPLSDGHFANFSQYRANDHPYQAPHQVYCPMQSLFSIEPIRVVVAKKAIFILFEIVTFCIVQELQVMSCHSNSIIGTRIFRGRVLPFGVRSFAIENPDFEWFFDTQYDIGHIINVIISYKILLCVSSGTSLYHLMVHLMWLFEHYTVYCTLGFGWKFMLSNK